MPTSRYIAALVRTHIAANPPLTIKELATLKGGVSILSSAECFGKRDTVLS